MGTLSVVTGDTLMCVEWIYCVVMAQKVGESLRGEMTVVESQHRKLVQFSLIETLAETMRLSSSEVCHHHVFILVHDSKCPVWAPGL